MPILLNNTGSKFGLVAILLHWVMAILIIGLFILGHYMSGLDYYDPWYHDGPHLHKSMGIGVLILLLLRYFWKMIQDTPAPFANYTVWELKLSKIIHWLFYIFLMIACISGYLIATAKGAGAEFFTFFTIDAMVTLNETKAEFVEEVHEIVNWLLAVLFILHAGAALKHHFIDKDNTLVRMLKPFND